MGWDQTPYRQTDFTDGAGMTVPCKTPSAAGHIS